MIFLMSIKLSACAQQVLAERGHPAPSIQRRPDRLELGVSSRAIGACRRLAAPLTAPLKPASEQDISVSPTPRAFFGRSNDEVCVLYLSGGSRRPKLRR